MESWIWYVILLSDNFSKLVNLYPVKNILNLKFVRAFQTWVGVLVPKNLRSYVGSQFTISSWSEFNADNEGSIDTPPSFRV